MAGYALTGETREHALFFLYGTGGNGKGTFVNALCGCVDDYHRSAPMDAFTETRYERHPTDLAGFRGARLVTGVETEEGRHWAESKIKTLTGGDKISARIMPQDFFEYWPQFKLLIMATTDPASDQLTKLSGAASTSFRSHYHHPGGARYRAGRQAQGRVARDSRLDDPGVPRLAKAWPCLAGSPCIRDCGLSRSRRYPCRVDGRMLHPRPRRTGTRLRSFRELVRVG